MSDAELSSLDSEELTRLAVLDSTAGRHDTAIVKLKRAVLVDPSNAWAHYMLGAEHAEIGLTERAIAEMTKAIELNPRLETAHFQLGLLYYTLSNLEQASLRWLPLDELGDANALYLFKEGLLKLAASELKAAENQLVLASAASRGQSDGLRVDIERVLGNLRRHMADQANATEATDSNQYGSNLARRYGDLDS